MLYRRPSASVLLSAAPDITMFSAVLLALATLAVAAPSPNAVAFIDPAKNGGSWLDVAGTGVGEPMNVRTSLTTALQITD